MSDSIIRILPPIAGSKRPRQRKWTAVIGGVEVSGENEGEVRKKAVTLIMKDPIFLEINEAFAQFQKAMIAYAKDEVNSETYPGDDYYLQDDPWRDHFDSGDTPEEAVDSDMSYWDEHENLSENS